MTEQESRNQQHVQTFLDSLRAGEARAIRELLQTLHPAEVADVLESLPAEARKALWKHLDAARKGAVLAGTHSSVRFDLMREMDVAEVADAISRLESDDVADILQELPQRLASEILLLLDEQNRFRVAQLLDFPRDCAGGLMSVETITVRSDVDVDVVLRYLRRIGNLPKNLDQLFVVDRSNRFLGVVQLTKLLITEPDLKVSEIMTKTVNPISAESSERDVATIFEQLDLVSAPVVDSGSKLIGRITIDDVVDVIREENDRSFLSTAGLDDDYDIFAPLSVTARQRAFWLALNLATAFLAAAVIGIFEATIEQLVALAVLMPIVASMGGIAGSQTLTVVVRGLALGQIGSANARQVLRRETILAFLNGCLWAIVVAAIAALWFTNLKLGVIIACAMLLNLLTAGLAGAYIPILLRRLEIDPAVAGGVVLTTLTDVVGFFVFLGLAAKFLV